MRWRLPLNLSAVDHLRELAINSVELRYATKPIPEQENQHEGDGNFRFLKT